MDITCKLLGNSIALLFPENLLTLGTLLGLWVGVGERMGIKGKSRMRQRLPLASGLRI